MAAGVEFIGSLRFYLVEKAFSGVVLELAFIESHRAECRLHGCDRLSIQKAFRGRETRSFILLRFHVTLT